MNIAAIIADLVRAGTDPDLVGRVAEAFSKREPVVVVDEQAERRRAADRERKQAKKNPQNSADSAEEKPAKEIPPTPPKENTTPISNEIGNSRAREADFEELRKAYPKREGGDPRQKAWKAYEAALKRGAKHADVLAGAVAFRRFRANDDPRFTPHMATWLNQRGWLDDYSAPPPRAGPNGRPKRDGYTEAIFELMGGNYEPDHHSQDYGSGDFASGVVIEN